jgi:hypothetical protein
MFTKTTLRLALIVATTSVSLAATRPRTTGAYVATDPDPNVRLDLRQDRSRGIY